jgi:hypothetical protein
MVAVGRPQPILQNSSKPRFTPDQRGDRMEIAQKGGRVPSRSHFHGLQKGVGCVSHFSPSPMCCIFTALLLSSQRFHVHVAIPDLAAAFDLQGEDSADGALRGIVVDGDRNHLTIHHVDQKCCRAGSARTSSTSGSKTAGASARPSPAGTTGSVAGQPGPSRHNKRSLIGSPGN